VKFKIIAIPLAVGCGLSAAACGLAIWHFGSVAALAAVISGDSFVVEPARFDLGEVLAGDERSAVFTVRNLSRDRIRVVGLEVSCTCLRADGLPISIAPGCDGEVVVRVHVKSGAFNQGVGLLVDDGRVEIRNAEITAVGVPR
jgi:hypothetical protein